jgi:hypothetical protein
MCRIYHSRGLSLNIIPAITAKKNYEKLRVAALWSEYVLESPRHDAGVIPIQ